MPGKAGTVRVGISGAHIHRAVAGMTRFLLLLTGGTVLLGAVGAYLLASLIVNPVVQLTTASEAIRSGNLQQRVPVRGGGEVARLAKSFNVMADALARSQGEIEEVNKQLVRRNTGLSVLNVVSQAVNQSLDLQDILDCALEEMWRVLNVKVGWVLLKADDGRLKLAAAKGFSEASPPDVVEQIPEQCACRQTLAEGTSHIVDGSPICLRGGLEVLRREGLGCHASVPLRAKEKVLGIMNLAYPTGQRFAEDDIQLLDSAGRQIGMAVENARLYEDLRRKGVQLISAQEDERTRIARELHDEAGQSLTALLLQLGELEQMLPPVRHGANPAKQRLAGLQSATARIIQEISRLMMDLRPTLLADLGLMPAVRSLADSQLGSAGVRVHFEIHGAARRLTPSIEISLFRIFQEAITNIKKHAQAASCTIQLVFKPSSVSAMIMDDGRGFDTVASRGSWRAFGLVGIEERVALLGGTLQIDSQKQRGTRITLEIPAPPA